MTVGDTIKGSGIGTITGVTTIASDTVEVSAEPVFDASNTESATSSTGTASTNINNKGNSRRQVNINTNGKHRHR